MKNLFPLHAQNFFSITRIMLFIVQLMFIYLEASAQDKIIRKDGTEIKAKILSTDETYIKYKRFDNLMGPDYFVYKNEVGRIEYETKPTPIEESHSSTQQKQTTPANPAPHRPILPELATLEHQALRYKRKSKLTASLGIGALAAGIITYLGVNSAYNTYKNQLNSTNAQYTGWYTTNYNSAPAASDLVEPKSLSTFGTPGVYIAAVGIISGVTFGWLGLKNVRRYRQTRTEIEQKRRQLSLEPFFKGSHKIVGMHITFRF